MKLSPAENGGAAGATTKLLGRLPVTAFSPATRA